MMPHVHVHGGSIFLDRLAEAGFEGDKLEWCDPVCDGPTPAGIPCDAWYALRARHLADSSGAAGAGAVEAALRAQDQALISIPPAAEVVLWFGPELFCQSILVRLLAWFAERSGTRAVSVVEASDLPGVRGCTLLELSTVQLRARFERRVEADREVLELAASVWRAWTAPDPAPLERLSASDASRLPFLGDAIRRHLAELPDPEAGLSATERSILAAVDSGARSERQIWSGVNDREVRPWITDVILRQNLRRLSSGVDALLSVAPAGEGPAALRLTGRGARVLAGRERWACPRWVGGVRVGGRD